MTDRAPDQAHRDARFWGRLVGIAVLVVVLIAFAVQNAADVNIDLFWWGWTTPLAVGLVATAALGFVLGWLVTRFSRRL